MPTRCSGSTKFHIDGLRVDAVASMLYLDYSRKADEWVPNEFGGNENLAAIAFLKRLNELPIGEGPAPPPSPRNRPPGRRCRGPTYVGGLGFGYKWNMGWMHDTLSYIGDEPIHRRYHQNDLTFGLLYAFPRTSSCRSATTRWCTARARCSARCRATAGRSSPICAPIWLHVDPPGQEAAVHGRRVRPGAGVEPRPEPRLASARRSMHAACSRWCATSTGSTGAPGAAREGLRAAGLRVDRCQRHGELRLSYLRRGSEVERPCLTVCNFTPMPRHEYRVGVPCGGSWRERLNSDAAEYGGSGLGNAGTVEAEAVTWHGRPYSLLLTLPPLGTIVLEPAR
jgi:1,4-alpha-glucan branching enzyme